MIRNVIFDMGNVLLRFDRELFLDRLGATGEDRKMLLREVYLSVEWVGLDRGTLTEETAEPRMCARLPERLHRAIHELTSRWDEPLVPVPGMQELVAELKERGYGLYLLSNASRRQHEYWPRLPASGLFDGTFISADHGVIKPQPEIYKLFLEKFGLTAEECFFVDDSAANIEAGNLCGIPGAVFHGDVERLRGELRTAGVCVAE